MDWQFYQQESAKLRRQIREIQTSNKYVLQINRPGIVCTFSSFIHYSNSNHIYLCDLQANSWRVTRGFKPQGTQESGRESGESHWKSPFQKGGWLSKLESIIFNCGHVYLYIVGFWGLGLCFSRTSCCFLRLSWCKRE